MTAAPLPGSEEEESNKHQPKEGTTQHSLGRAACSSSLRRCCFAVPLSLECCSCPLSFFGGVVRSAALPLLLEVSCFSSLFPSGWCYIFPSFFWVALLISSLLKGYVAYHSLAEVPAHLPPSWVALLPSSSFFLCSCPW